MKRLFDILVAAVGLVLLSPLLMVIAALVKLTSPGPVLFRQERIGRSFRPFFIYKFRSMVQDAPRQGGPITFGDDPRITRFGRFLRRTKLDEAPQLINVLAGDMSLVGPRPEVRRYVELFRKDYDEMISIRPGITDLASLEYCDEAGLLGQSANPEEQYLRHVLPAKIAMAKKYVRQQTFAGDLLILGKTALALCGRRPAMPVNQDLPADGRSFPSEERR